MDAIIENRISKRINNKATVLVETRDTGIFHYVTMHNFSGDGIYCGSDCSFRPGTFITIRIDNPHYASAPKVYLGEVRRCEKLEGDHDSHLYGLGIKIIKAIND
jgi:hypothetical protein